MPSPNLGAMVAFVVQDMRVMPLLSLSAPPAPYFTVTPAGGVGGEGDPPFTLRGCVGPVCLSPSLYLFNCDKALATESPVFPVIGAVGQEHSGDCPVYFILKLRNLRTHRILLN